jgi:hypothetical protein
VDPETGAVEGEGETAFLGAVRAHDFPVFFDGDGFEEWVWIDHDGVLDETEHGEVGLAVGVGP